MKAYKIYLSGKIAGLTPDSVLANFAQAKRDAFYRANQEGAEWNEIMIVDPSALPKVQKSWADYIIRDKIAFWKKTGTFNFSAQFGKNRRLIGLNEISYREQSIFLQMLGQTAEGVNEIIGHKNEDK